MTLSPRLGGVAGLGLPLYIVFNPHICQKLLYEALAGAATERAAVQEEEEEEESGLVGKLREPRRCFFSTGFHFVSGF